MADWEKCSAVERHPEKKGGAWLFAGTRVPIATLFNNLKEGATIHEVVEWFPGVEISQVEEVLQFEIDSLDTRVKI